MHDQNMRSEQLPRCFRCQAGCIHLVCGNTMLTLTQMQFLSLADAVGAMRRQLNEEDGSAAVPAYSTSLVM